MVRAGCWNNQSLLGLRLAPQGFTAPTTGAPEAQRLKPEASRLSLFTSLPAPA